MEKNFVFLTEKEEMWAKMLIQVLENEKIPCAVLPVYGAGTVLKTGVRERLKIYVPYEKQSLAETLLQQLFGDTADTAFE